MKLRHSVIAFAALAAIAAATAFSGAARSATAEGGGIASRSFVQTNLATPQISSTSLSMGTPDAGATKARTLLRWSPPLAFAQTVQLTAEWYRSFSAQPAHAKQLTMQQIDRYRESIVANAHA